MSGFVNYQDPTGDKIAGKDNPFPTQAMNSFVKDVVFQSAVGATGNGTPQSVKGYKTLVVEVFGATSPAGTVNFQAAGQSGYYSPITGTKLNGYSQAISTTNIPTGTTPQPDQWQFDVSALDSFQCPVTWTAGSITVLGRLMA